MTTYQLGVMYYAQDMLQDAGAMVGARSLCAALFCCCGGSVHSSAVCFVCSLQNIHTRALQLMLLTMPPQVQQAAQVLRQHYPEDHDLLVLCRHRLGEWAA